MSRTTERNNQIRASAELRLTQLGLSLPVAQSIVKRMPLMEIVALRSELHGVVAMRLSDPADDAANLSAEGM